MRGLEGHHPGVFALPDDIEPTRAFEIVGPSSRDDGGPQLGETPRVHVQDAGLKRAHDPLVGTRAVRVTAERLDVNGEDTEGLRTIHVHPRVLPTGQFGDPAHGEQHARGGGDMRQSDYLRARRDDTLESGDQASRLSAGTLTGARLTTRLSRFARISEATLFDW